MDYRVDQERGARGAESDGVDSRNSEFQAGDLGSSDDEPQGPRKRRKASASSAPPNQTILSPTNAKEGPVTSAKGGMLKAGFPNMSSYFSGTAPLASAPMSSLPASSSAQQRPASQPDLRIMLQQMKTKPYVLPQTSGPSSLWSPVRQGGASQPAAAPQQTAQMKPYPSQPAAAQPSGLSSLSVFMARQSGAPQPSAAQQPAQIKPLPLPPSTSLSLPLLQPNGASHSVAAANRNDLIDLEPSEVMVPPPLQSSQAQASIADGRSTGFTPLIQHPLLVKYQQQHFASMKAQQKLAADLHAQQPVQATTLAQQSSSNRVLQQQRSMSSAQMQPGSLDTFHPRQSPQPFSQSLAVRTQEQPVLLKSPQMQPGPVAAPEQPRIVFKPLLHSPPRPNLSVITQPQQQPLPSPKSEQNPALRPPAQATFLASPVARSQPTASPQLQQNLSARTLSQHLTSTGPQMQQSSSFKSQFQQSPSATPQLQQNPLPRSLLQQAPSAQAQPQRSPTSRPQQHEILPLGAQQPPSDPAPLPKTSLTLQQRSSAPAPVATQGQMQPAASSVVVLRGFTPVDRAQFLKVAIALASHEAL